MSSVEIISLREISLSLPSKLLWALAWGGRVHLVWGLGYCPSRDGHPSSGWNVLIPVWFSIVHSGRLQGPQGLAVSEVRAQLCVAAWGHEPSTPAHTRCSRGPRFWLPPQIGGAREHRCSPSSEPMISSGLLSPFSSPIAQGPSLGFFHPFHHLLPKAPVWRRGRPQVTSSQNHSRVELTSPTLLSSPLSLAVSLTCGSLGERWAEGKTCSPGFSFYGLWRAQSLSLL